MAYSPINISGCFFCILKNKSGIPFSRICIILCFLCCLFGSPGILEGHFSFFYSLFCQKNTFFSIFQGLLIVFVCLIINCFYFRKQLIHIIIIFFVIRFDTDNYSCIIIEIPALSERKGFLLKIAVIPDNS